MLTSKSSMNLGYKLYASMFLLISLLAGCATNPPNTAAVNLEEANKVRFEDTAKGLAIKINEGLLFGLGETVYITDADKVLDELMSVINLARSRILVEGHTDTSGNDNINLRLSKARADKVKQSLIERKVSPSRILATGYGSKQLEKDPERTPADARLNRRAVILLEGENRKSIGADVAEDRMANMLNGLVGSATRTGNAIMESGASFLRSINNSSSGVK